MAVRKRKSSTKKSTTRSSKKVASPLMGWKAKPISAGFFTTSILGFLIAGYLVYPISMKFGFAFMVVFALMFVSSLISMTFAPISSD